VNEHMLGHPRGRGGKTDMKLALAIAAALVALAAPLSAQAGGATHQTADVLAWTEATTTLSPPVYGTATLMRNDNGIGMTFHTTGLPAGDAVTIWWIIIDPSGNVVSAQFAAGHVIGNDGVGNFAGYLGEGDTSGCFATWFPCLGLSTDPAQGDSRTANVLLLARVHGPAEPGRIPTQIHTSETTDEEVTCSETLCQVQGAFFPAVP